MNAKRIEQIGRQLQDIERAIKAFKKSHQMSFPVNSGVSITNIVSVSVNTKAARKVFIIALKDCRKQLRAELKELA
jgi:hypothetical protein